VKVTFIVSVHGNLY